MKLLKSFSVLAFCLILTACKVENTAIIDVPELYNFEVVDSYNNSNLTSPRTPSVNPTIDNGYFEIYWDIESFNSYTTALYINDVSNLNGAIELDYNTCSYNNDCAGYGFSYCSYSQDDYLNCSSKTHQNLSVDIYPLIDLHPAPLYLILEVCDKRSGACTMQHQKVFFE